MPCASCLETIVWSSRSPPPHARKAEVGHARRVWNLQAGREEWQAGDWQFHQTFYAAANRRRQIALIADLRQTCALHLAHYDDLITATSRWLKDHLALAGFRAKESAKAVKILTTHLTAAPDYLLQRLN